jgi:hypothetical protein
MSFVANVGRYCERLGADASQRLPVDLSVARRRAVGGVGWPAAEFTSSCRVNGWASDGRSAGWHGTVAPENREERA